MNNLVRSSKENPNAEEAFKGKWGYSGIGLVSLTVMKNVLYIVAQKGAKCEDVLLPEVFDGFLVLSDGSTVPVENSKLTLDLGPDTSAQGILKLVKDN